MGFRMQDYYVVLIECEIDDSLADLIDELTEKERKIFSDILHVCTLRALQITSEALLKERKKHGLEG